MKMKGKPEHNQFDNIWEIRQSYPHIESWIELDLKKAKGEGIERIGNANICYYIEDFLKTLVSAKRIELPVYKILFPSEEGKRIGHIFYVAKCDDVYHIFRGTYGYGGTGPHESARVEHLLEKIGLSIDLRYGDADLLLALLR